VAITAGCSTVTGQAVEWSYEQHTYDDDDDSKSSTQATTKTTTKAATSKASAKKASASKGYDVWAVYHSSDGSCDQKVSKAPCHRQKTHSFLTPPSLTLPPHICGR